MNEKELVQAAIIEGRRIDKEIARLRRDRSQLTVRALAEKMGRSTRTIRAWASGTRGR